MGAGAPLLAVLADELTPYRAHFHRRIAAEMPELELWTLLTRDPELDTWRPPEGNNERVVRFGVGRAKAWKRGRFAGLTFDWQEARRIVRWLEERRARALFSVGYTEWPLFRPQLWAKRRRVPILRWSDAIGTKTTPWRRHVIGWASAHLTCGSAGKEHLLSHGAEPESIFFVPYEPDYPQIERIDRGAAELATGLPSGRRRFLFCGRLVESKRPDLAVDAFVRIAEQRPEWDLIVVGEGPLRHQLEAHVPEQARQRVRFTGFLADQHQVAQLQRACDVLVHPADHEPWGVIINEAAAAGLAIIASEAVGAGRELVRDGQNGRVVRRSDLPALENAMLEVTESKRLVTLQAAAARVLADWRETADPIRGLREAVRFVGVLPAT